MPGLLFYSVTRISAFDFFYPPRQQTIPPLEAKLELPSLREVDDGYVNGRSLRRYVTCCTAIPGQLISRDAQTDLGSPPPSPLPSPPPWPARSRPRSRNVKVYEPRWKRRLFLDGLKPYVDSVVPEDLNRSVASARDIPSRAYFHRANLFAILRPIRVVQLPNSHGRSSCHVDRTKRNAQTIPSFPCVTAHAPQPVTAVPPFPSVTESLTLTSKPGLKLTHPRQPHTTNKNYRFSVPRSRNFDNSRHLPILCGTKANMAAVVPEPSD